MNVDRAGFVNKCIAVRLCTILDILASYSVYFNEKDIRTTIRELYGKTGRGMQHFLDTCCTSSTPIRTCSYKCIFISYADVQDVTITRLQNGIN